MRFQTRVRKTGLSIRCHAFVPGPPLLPNAVRNRFHPWLQPNRFLKTTCCIARGCRLCSRRRSQTFSSSSSSILLKKGRSRVLPGLAIAVAFLSVGYVFSEPLRGEGTTNSVAKICGRVLERTQGWLHRPNGDETPPATVQVAEENGSPQFVRPGRAVGRIHDHAGQRSISKRRSAHTGGAGPTDSC